MRDNPLKRRGEMNETGGVDVADRNFGYFEVDYDDLPPEGVRFSNLSPRGNIQTSL